MARRESDREDLLREATALVERVELEIAGFDEPIVVGFRRDGCASFFFGADPVYQFNSAGELRRGYIDGLLYKAEGGRLIGLLRERTQSAIQLRRLEPSPSQAAEILCNALTSLNQLRESLRQASFNVVGQEPRASDVIGRISDWLGRLPSAIRVAQAAHVS